MTARILARPVPSSGAFRISGWQLFSITSRKNAPFFLLVIKICRFSAGTFLQAPMALSIPLARRIHQSTGRTMLSAGRRRLQLIWIPSCSARENLLPRSASAAGIPVWTGLTSSAATASRQVRYSDAWSISPAFKSSAKTVRWFFMSWRSARVFCSRRSASCI